MAYRERVEATRIEIAVASIPGPTMASAGAVAGIVAGVVMAGWAMLFSAYTAAGFWLPPQLIAATVFGPVAMVRGMEAVLIGVLLHVVVSAGFGILFALMTGWRPLGGGELIVAGLAYGAAIWAVMTFGILPLVNPTMSARVALEPANWLFQHLLFGALLALLAPLRRSFTPVRP